MEFLIINIWKEKVTRYQEPSVLPGKGGHLWILIPQALIRLEPECCCIELLFKESDCLLV